MNKKYEELLKQILKRKGHDDEKLVFTRRQFIQHGLIAGGGALLPLNPFQKVFAKADLFQPQIPFLVLDLAGGAGLPASFLVGKTGGPEDLCRDYRGHGWNPRSSGSLDKTFGIPMSAKRSEILAGLKRNLPSDILNQGDDPFFQMASLCNFSLSDVSSNKASAISIISKMGLVGSVLKSGLGQVASPSGGNSEALQADLQLQPKLVTSPSDLLKITSLGDDFLRLNGETKQKIRKLLGAVAQDYPDLIEAYQELAHFGDLHEKGDPRKSDDMVSIFGLTDNSTDQEVTEAGIIYNVLMGYTGPGVITIGDCDYHLDQTAELAANKDLEIGSVIGKAVHAAHVLKKPLFIQIITDGGVYSVESDNYERTWAGDQNLHSLTLVGYYDPTRSSRMSKHQVGEYTENGQVRLASAVQEAKGELFVSKKPENMVLAVIGNYLKLHGEEGRIQELTGARLSTQTIDDFLVFG